MLQYLKVRGLNCLSLTKQLDDKCHRIKEQINQTIATMNRYLPAEYGKTDQLFVRKFIRDLSTCAINIMAKIVQITMFNDQQISLIATNSSKNNQIEISQTNTKCINSTDQDQIKEHIQLLILLNSHIEEIISLVSTIDLHLTLVLSNHIDILIEQIQLIDSNMYTISEQNFHLELIKLHMNQFYDESSALFIMFCIYVNVSDKFAVDRFCNGQLLELYAKRTVEHNSLFHAYFLDMNDLKMQLTKLIQAEKITCTVTYGKLRNEFSQLLKDLSIVA